MHENVKVRVFMNQKALRAGFFVLPENEKEIRNDIEHFIGSCRFCAVD